MSRRKRKKIIALILLVILLVVIAISSFFFFKFLVGVDAPTTKAKEQPIVKKQEQPKEQKIIKKETKPYTNNIPSYRQQYGNDNIYGRLKIPAINLDAFIVRTTNNSYYLDYDLYNQYDGIGTSFFDYRNTSLSTNKQINIYGHNTQNAAIYDKVPFLKLERYTEAGMMESAKDIYLEIDEKEVHYIAFAVKVIDKTDNEHMILLADNDNYFIKHVKLLRENTMYNDETVDITMNDRILVLQTCHYNPENTYLLVMAKEQD